MYIHFSFKKIIKKVKQNPLIILKRSQTRNIQKKLKTKNKKPNNLGFLLKIHNVTSILFDDKKEGPTTAHLG